MISLITGVGAKGQVGEAVAGALAMRGDRVLLVGREREVEKRAAELRANGLHAHAYVTDLADPEAVEQLAQRVRADHGDQLNAVVNLAGGFGLSGPIAESDVAGFERQLRINLTTAYLTTRAFLPLARDGHASIVFFASEAVLEGMPTSGIVAYAAAKAGVVALMRSVADEARARGVRANALAPASIRTATNEKSMGPDTEYVEREDVAAAVAFLCSPASRAITGQVIRLQP